MTEILPRDGETWQQRDIRLHLDQAEQLVRSAAKTGLTPAVKAQVRRQGPGKVVMLGVSRGDTPVRV